MNRILSRALALVHTVIEYASIDGGRIIVGVRPWTSFGLRCPVCGRAANATTGRQGRGCGARWTWRGRPLRARAARDGGVPARLREDGRRGRAGLRLRLRGDDARRGRRPGGQDHQPAHSVVGVPLRQGAGGLRLGLPAVGPSRRDRGARDPQVRGAGRERPVRGKPRRGQDASRRRAGHRGSQGRARGQVRGLRPARRGP